MLTLFALILKHLLLNCFVASACVLEDFCTLDKQRFL